ncbi:hypothetical protein ACFQAV_12550 [Companilactobacillus huachuanensis]|uniref:DNA-directed RNA polymerase subunit beta n=1 Tax=Companilactobacillus huachuanensis TaxID=2559914 RepID=A0ABW1RQE8_9LACO|nr:hypothetical protein [Companilactobacillus huachuanensis]
MDLFKFNSKIAFWGIILVVVGLVLAFATLFSLDFDISALINHGGSWYAPIKWK